MRFLKPVSMDKVIRIIGYPDITSKSVNIGVTWLNVHLQTSG